MQKALVCSRLFAGGLSLCCQKEVSHRGASGFPGTQGVQQIRLCLSEKLC